MAETNAPMDVTRKECLVFNLTTSVSSYVYIYRADGRMKYRDGTQTEWYWRGENRSTGKKILSQCHFVHYKSHESCPDIRGGEQGAKTENLMTKMNLWPMTDKGPGEGKGVDGKG